MKSKILQSIQRNNMFAQGAVLLAAVSGGADSVALLHFLYTLREEWELTLGALHLNHRLRGEESERDEAFVRELCGRWRIPLTVESADVAAVARAGKISLEEAGRSCRYDFFSAQAKGQGAKVATAHTRSDSAETVLLNLTRGTALRGLAGIPPVRDLFVRPLIDCTRAEIERYCAEHGLAFVTDSTNQSDAYTRNRIRRHVIPLMERENPAFPQALARMSQLVRADAEYLDGQALIAADSLAQLGGKTDRAGFLALPQALRGRVLGILLRRARVEAESRVIWGLEELIERGAGSRQLAPGAIFRCDGEVFSVERIEARQPFFEAEVPLSQAELGCTVEVFYGKRVNLAVKEAKYLKKTQFFQKKDLTYCLDCDRIRKIVTFVTLRQRLPDDRLRLPGRGCTKTLKNLFQERGVDAVQRLRRVVLAAGGKPLWVEGIGPDESVRVDEATKHVLTIEITEGAHDGGYFKGSD